MYQLEDQAVIVTFTVKITIMGGAPSGCLSWNHRCSEKQSQSNEQRYIGGPESRQFHPYRHTGAAKGSCPFLLTLLPLLLFLGWFLYSAKQDFEYDVVSSDPRALLSDRLFENVAGYPRIAFSAKPYR